MFSQASLSQNMWGKAGCYPTQQGRQINKWNRASEPMNFVKVFLNFNFIRYNFSLKNALSNNIAPDDAPTDNKSGLIDRNVLNYWQYKYFIRD